MESVGKLVEGELKKLGVVKITLTNIESKVSEGE